jgi:DNA adenine methylase/adenine-specific DNA-methyltransferase
MVAKYPRLRYMGSKYRVMPHLVNVFTELEFDTAVDAFTGSGVVAYALKAMGKAVTASDFLNFPATVARAIVENPGLRLTTEEMAAVAGPNRDGRDFIRRTFQGLYFPDEDHDFLDAAWSNLEALPTYKRDLAVAALCLAAARKQPRGVFTITDFRYDDGRRNLRLPLRDMFVEAVHALNAVVFDNGRQNVALRENVTSLDPRGYDLAYFDPPYAPPRDDNDYIKRYHFLEGLSCYWKGTEIMERTKTKKLTKRFTPYAYKHTITPALVDLFDRFKESTIVLSYSSNSVPDQHEIVALLRAVKARVEVIAVPHRYSFGTHSAAVRRQANEFIFVAR